ncbi:hypothetical protein, partial [Parapedobacter defluvii]|uniref:hypothetical protein n=1 Tax=Parapedobacter defluvii TaxID=2045106 RepID=UPI003340C5F4
MNKKTKILGALAWSILIGFSSCKKDDPGPGDGSSQKYLVQTMSEIAQVKPGHTAAYSEFPTGTINNSAQTGALGASGNEGFRTYNGMVFKMFNGSFERGIYRLLVDGTGRVSYDTKSIKTSNSHSGSGNFVIENDTKGYYWDGDSPWEIHTFNPTALERTGSLGNYEAELKKSDAGINFQAIGQHFLAIKEGKLYADVTYSEGSEQRGGVFNDFFPDVTIAVIDLQTGDLEKTTVIKNTGAIAFINDNEMYSFDQQGNLYIVCQGTNAAFGTNSKIARIKKGETDIDATWELKFSDYRSADDGKFVGVFAEGDRLVLTVNTEPLT